MSEVVEDKIDAADSQQKEFDAVVDKMLDSLGFGDVPRKEKLARFILMNLTKFDTPSDHAEQVDKLAEIIAAIKKENISSAIIMILHKSPDGASHAMTGGVLGQSDELVALKLLIDAICETPGNTENGNSLDEGLASALHAAVTTSTEKALADLADAIAANSHS